MQLSYRLKTVADMVSKNNRVADIGCDHAYVSIYLIKNQIASKVIALDINIGPLKIANENINNHGMVNLIETRLSNGAKQLQPREVDTILIAGMGGALMSKILTESRKVVDSCEELVLQPQSEIFLIRKLMEEIGFKIIEEDMLIDENKYYTIIKAKKDKNLSQDLYGNEVHYRYGKILLEKNNPVLKLYLQEGLKVNNKLIEELIKSDSIKAKERIEEIMKDIEYIKEGLNYYEM